MRQAPVLFVLLALLLAWQAVHVLSGSADIPAPLATALMLCHLSGEISFWQDMGTTGEALVAALLIAVPGGVALGVLLGLSRAGRTLLEPLLTNFQALPKVTLYPIVLAFCGLGMAPKVAFGVMHALIPVSLLTTRAILQVRPVHWRTARALRLPLAVTLRHVLLPSVLPELFGALRVACSLSLLGVLIGEMFAAKAGLGFAAMNAMGQGDTLTTTAIGVFIALFAILVDLFLLSARQRLSPQIRQSQREQKFFASFFQKRRPSLLS